MRVRVLSSDRRWASNIANLLSVEDDVVTFNQGKLFAMSTLLGGADLILIHYGVISAEPVRLLRDVLFCAEDAPVIVAQVPDDPDLILSLLHIGAAGYTREGSDQDELLRIMAFTIEGITLLDREITTWLSHQHRNWPEHGDLPC